MILFPFRLGRTSFLAVHSFIHRDSRDAWRKEHFFSTDVQNWLFYVFGQTMSQLHGNDEHHREKSLLASMATSLQTGKCTKKEKTSKSINVRDRLTRGTCRKKSSNRAEREEKSDQNDAVVRLIKWHTWSFSLLAFANRRLDTFDMPLVVGNWQNRERERDVCIEVLFFFASTWQESRIFRPLRHRSISYHRRQSSDRIFQRRNSLIETRDGEVSFLFCSFLRINLLKRSVEKGKRREKIAVVSLHRL